MSVVSEARPLDGRVAIITGGARGQGAAEAELLARRGAAVVIADVLEQEGARCAERIVEEGGAAVFEPLDVTDQASWTRVVERAVAEFGRVDALVNNAGISDPARLDTVDRETFTHLMDVNAFGALLGTRAVAGTMARGGGGSIVNISSMAGLIAWSSVAYVMSKWAMTGLTKVAAMELGSRGIRVNSVHPGMVDTPMLGVQGGSVRRRYAAVTPLGRLAEPEDIAPLVAFLCSPESAYISGAQISADGGFIAAGLPMAVLDLE